MKTELKKTLWYITKQTMGEEMFGTIFHVMKYFVEEEKYDPKKFKEYWTKLPIKGKEETKSKETTRNLIIAKFLGLLNLDETPTQIGYSFIENINNESILREIIEDCKINFRLNRDFSNKSDLDRDSLNKIEPFRIFHDFLLMAEKDKLKVNDSDYKYYISFIPDYDSLKEHYEAFKLDKTKGINVNSKEDYQKYKSDIANIRHNGLWKDSRHIYFDRKMKTFKLRKNNPFKNDYKITLIEEKQIKELMSKKRKSENTSSNSHKRTDEIEQKILKSSSENGRKAEELVWDKILEGNFYIGGKKITAIDQTYINDTNAGYDILAYKGDEEIKIEVKSNQKNSIEFFITRNELNLAERDSNSFYIVLVNLENREIRILCWKELRDNLSLEPEIFKAKLKNK